jgi:hypothetical protein
MVNFLVELQYRYSVVFFIAPWDVGEELRCFFCFSLIGKGISFRNLRRELLEWKPRSRPWKRQLI